MDQDRLLELVSRKLSGEASREELKELEDLLSSDPEAAERHRILDRFWNKQDAGCEPAVEEGLAKLLAGLGLPQSGSVLSSASETLPDMDRRYRILSPGFRNIAALLILFAGLSTVLFLLYHPAKNETPAIASLLLEKHNAKGTKSTIQLPDGSKVWLNADSKIGYPEIFAGPAREVYLNGEAYFDVVKNPAHPFIIHLANGTVRVLGTSFNIRAYDNEPTVETAVTTGRIAFIPKYRNSRKPQDTVFLAPDHKASYTYSKEELTTSTTSGAEEKAWTEGTLIFRSMTLEQIAVELERNFGKRVVFVDEEPKAYILTGSFQNNTLEQIMYYLTRTKDFKYKITGSELLIAGPDGSL